MPLVTYTPSYAGGPDYCLYTSSESRVVFKNIIFYRDGAVVTETGSGGFAVVLPGHNHCRLMPGLTLSKPLVRRTTVDLSKGGHFWFPTTRKPVAPECSVYIDLALKDYILDDDEREIMNWRDREAKRFARVRNLTGVFGTVSRVETIAFRLPVVERVEYTAFGDLMIKVAQHVASQRRQEDVHALRNVINDPKLMLLLLRAATEAKLFGDNPTVESAAQQLIVLATMSV